MKLSYWLLQYEQSDKEQRLGQKFCNDYIKHDWAELFYEQDNVVAIAMITYYLIDMHYYPNVPYKIGEIS